MTKRLPVLVDDGIEGETISPGGGEVADVHIVVAGRLQLAPAHHTHNIRRDTTNKFIFM